MTTAMTLTDLELIEQSIHRIWSFARSLGRMTAGDEPLFPPVGRYPFSYSPETFVRIDCVLWRLDTLKRLIDRHACALNDGTEKTDHEWESIRSELNESLEIDLGHCSPVQLSALFHELAETVQEGLPTYLSLRKKLLSETPLSAAEQRIVASLQPPAFSGYATL